MGILLGDQRESGRNEPIKAIVCASLLIEHILESAGSELLFPVGWEMVSSAMAQANIAVRRNFAFTETLGLLFRVEAFNILNHAVFGSIHNSLSMDRISSALRIKPRTLIRVD